MAYTFFFPLDWLVPVIALEYLRYCGNVEQLNSLSLGYEGTGQDILIKHWEHLLYQLRCVSMQQTKHPI